MHDTIDLLGGDLLTTDAPATTPDALGEYVARPVRPETRVLVLPPDPAMMGQKYLKLHTQNKIRQAFHNLAINNLDAVQTWLHEIAKDSPKAAIDAFIELAKFSLPQLKETAVTVTQNNATKTYTSSQDILAELNAPE